MLYNDSRDTERIRGGYGIDAVRIPHKHKGAKMTDSYMNDERGCSKTGRGQERYEQFYSSIARGHRIQYDYRTPDGQLFSTVGRTLEICRARRDAWLEKQAA